MNERTLVRIDFQNDFVAEEGNLTINNPALIARHQHFNQSLQKGMFTQIIDAADTHFAETYPNTKEAQSFPPHTIYGTWGWQKAAEFKDNIPVVNLYKSTTNLWNEEKTYAVLQQDWRGKEVYVCGVLSDICVKQAMNGFLSRGAKVTVLEDLCMGANQQMPEIIQQPAYQKAVEAGVLRMMTMQQFFRQVLNEKKSQFNMYQNQFGR